MFVTYYALVGIFKINMFCVMKYTNLMKPFKNQVLHQIDDKSQYALCEYERFDDLIECIDLILVIYHNGFHLWQNNIHTNNENDIAYLVV